MRNIDRLFIEYNITTVEQKQIMEVMDKYRNLIAEGEKVTHTQYENDIVAIFGGDISAARHTPSIEYHFCGYVAKAFMEENRWEEVFHTVYGSFPKYGGQIQ